MTASVALPVLEVVFVAVGLQPGPRGGAGAVALVVVCLVPLSLRHVVAALQGRRPRGAWWTVATMAAVLGAAVDAVGPRMLALLPALVVPVMLLVRAPAAVAALLGSAAATTPLALALGDRFAVAAWYPAAVLWRSATLYVLVALVVVVHELHRARCDLADRAVLRERLRIDDELRRTVGAALADLGARGDRLLAVGAAPAELPDLVAASRGALAQARRLVGRYRRPLLNAELDAAVALLKAAGIEARVERATALLPGEDDGLRADLHATTARLLIQGPESVLLRIVDDGGTARLEVAR